MSNFSKKTNFKFSSYCSWTIQNEAIYFVNSMNCAVPGYSGRLSLYFSANDGGTKRPPRKCRPEKLRAHNFGAVSEMSESARNFCAGLTSMSSLTGQPVGTSSATTGKESCALIALTRASKGARRPRSAANEKPNSPSTATSNWDKSSESTFSNNCWPRATVHFFFLKFFQK